MDFKFEPPEKVVIEFRPWSPKAKPRRNLCIKKCVEIKSGKIITVAYIARDGKIHRHRYKKDMIKGIEKKGKIYIPRGNRIIIVHRVN